MERGRTTVVIGGGIIGLAIADELVRRGCPVTLVTAGEPGQGASSTNAGWIAPGFSGPVPAPGVLGSSLRWMLRADSPFYVRPRLSPSFLRWMLEFRANTSRARHGAGLEALATFNARTLALHDRWHAEGLAYEEHRSGVLIAAHTQRDAELEAEALAPLARFGFAEVVVGRAEEWEPALNDTFRAAVLLPEERHVDSGALAGALATRLRSGGTEIVVGDGALPLDPVGGRVEVVETVGGRRFPADTVVVAAGAWTPVVTRRLRVRLPILAGKGYALDFTPPPVAIRRPLYLHGDRVALTPYEERLRLSGTMELTGLDTSIATRRVAAIARAAARAIRGWPAERRPEFVGSGLRPLTPDGLPVIGRLGESNVFVASGHSMLGVTLAPATAEALVEVTTGGKTPAVIEPFDPGRLQGLRRPWRRRPVADSGGAGGEGGPRR